MCEYNLGTRQPDVVAMGEKLEPVPTLYFTQLLGIALGLEPDLYRLDLAGPAARDLLVHKNFVAAATV
jgi:heterodisulfide reductase subunit B